MISLKGSELPDEVEAASSEDELEEGEDDDDEQRQEESSSDDDSASDVPDDEMESGDNDDDDEEEDGEEKSGWADAMAKVLGMGKAAEPNKPLLLSKAKKDGEKAVGDTDKVNNTKHKCFYHFLNNI